MRIEQRFAWDPNKAASNLRKHGVSFDVAIHVFADEHRETEEDKDHVGERRWRTIGAVGGVRLVVVVHLTHEFLEDGSLIELIRVISAREPTRHERRRYERGTR